MVGLSVLVRQAAAARELRPGDLRVLVLVSDVLDFGEYRPLKAAWLAETLHMATSTANAALERLSAAGFLDRQLADPAQPVRYRLPASRTPKAWWPPKAPTSGSG